MDRLLIVSADSHVSPPTDAVAEYLEPSYREWLDAYRNEVAEHEVKYAFLKFTDAQLAVLDPEGLVRAGRDLGCVLGDRLEEMDREGIAAERILAANINAPLAFFHSAGMPYPPDVQLAGLRMYHRWVADFMAESGGRLFGVAYTGPCIDIERSIEEMRWVATHGFRSVTVPGEVADQAFAALPPLASDYYEPFWAACADLGLTLSMHAGHGYEQGRFQSFLGRVRSIVGEEATDEELQYAIKAGILPDSALAPNTMPQQVWWQLMAGGVFDRHPDLVLVFTEVRADWIPQTLAYFDARFDRGDTPLARRPSEYWAENCTSVASSIKRSEVRLRHEIGVDHLMFGRDYPHREGTWPNSYDWFRDAFAGVPEHEVRQILGENAIDCFGLDRDVLQRVADRIGPSPPDVLGDYRVDEQLLDSFAKRSGYDRSHENVDVEQLEHDIAQLVIA